MTTSITQAPALALGHTPAPRIHEDCIADESLPTSKAGIVIKLVRRLNRVLGQYSKENEERIGKDIVILIEGIKREEHNKFMTGNFVNRLVTGKDILKEVYKSAKYLTLELGQLMHEGVLESKAEQEHNNKKIEEEKEKVTRIIWAIRFELRILEMTINNESYDYLITDQIKTEVNKFIPVIRSDIDKFCAVHGIKEPQPSINEPPSTASPE